jgi:hypothetical protein
MNYSGLPLGGNGTPSPRESLHLDEAASTSSSRDLKFSGRNSGTNAPPKKREPIETIGSLQVAPPGLDRAAHASERDGRDKRKRRPLGRRFDCPSWARTRTLLIQSQACCQLHQGAVNLVVHGAEGARTPDLLGAIQALSQLSYSPKSARGTSIQVPPEQVSNVETPSNRVNPDRIDPATTEPGPQRSCINDVCAPISGGSPASTARSAHPPRTRYYCSNHRVSPTGMLDTVRLP